MTDLPTSLARLQTEADAGIWHASDALGDALAHIDDLTQQIAALTEAVKVKEWRDISTAPKDGTSIDLWGPHTGRWTSAQWKEDRWSRFSHGRGTVPVFYGRDPKEFTHWMPLPSPPEPQP